MAKNKPAITKFDIYEEQARSEALFTSMGDGAIVTDENGLISRINNVALNLLGYQADEVIGQWFPRFIAAYDQHGSPLDAIDRPITRAFISGRPVSEKTYYKTKFGKLVPVSLTVSPVVLKGKPIGAIEVIRDITAESEIDRMKSEFIALASHQLRTPLSAINTYSYMLRDGFHGPLNPGQDEFMDIILTSINRMNELINTLLSVSRIESGTVEIKTAQLNLEQLISQVLDELQPIMTKKNITFIRQLSQDSNLVSDPVLLKEVMSNLLSNAVKYTPDNGSVTLSSEIIGSDLKICVIDTGYGIPLDQQKQVFSRFFRANNIQHAESVGTGLGLYMVKQTIENLGGKIDFDSTENIGSNFYFNLPRDEPPETRFFKIL